MKIFRDPVVARGQVYLLPPSVEDFVPQESPARIVGEIIEGMDLSGLVSKYAGGGAPAYDPWMMMKVLVFGYSQGIRSSRKLDMALGQDLRFMYLSEMSRPDFRTIAAKRKERLAKAREVMEEAGRSSIGATGTESRLMKTGSGNKAAYNGQAAVDKERG